MTAAEATAAAAPLGGLEIASITPEPTDTERAAIVAAVEALQAEIWPHLGAAAVPAPSPRWRYAGRPWQRRARYGGWASENPNSAGGGQASSSRRRSR